MKSGKKAAPHTRSQMMTAERALGRGGESTGSRLGGIHPKCLLKLGQFGRSQKEEKGTGADLGKTAPMRPPGVPAPGTDPQVVKIPRSD